MVCPRCGREISASSGRCPSCAPADDRTIVASSVLTPPPTGTSPDLATILSGHADLTSLAAFGFPAAAIDAASDSGPLGVGQAFGSRYHIIRLLGVGGMGAVYQAWDAELGVAVAIKVIRPDVMSDPAAAAEIERRFKRELLLARQVTHKNVVRIHDLGEINGIKYITMPYVDGADLATVLKREGRLPVSRVLRIARSVVSGLVEAHKAGVVHRDLKPANIMIGADDDAMIMDFGIARSTGNPAAHAVPGANTIVRGLRAAAAGHAGTILGAVVGTLEYMAPEQAKGQPVDQRADVYAFGLILYDMLVGPLRTANADDPLSELQARMLQAPPSAKSLVADIPERVDGIVSRAIEPDPANRFQTSAELAGALAALDDDGKPIPVPARFGRRTIAAAAAIAATLVAATWYLTRTPPVPKQHDPVTVLISDLQNATGDPSFDHTLEPVLKLALEGAGFINAQDRARMRATFGVQPPDKLDEAAARQIAIKQGLGVVLSGAIARKGDGYDVSVRAVQPVTGNVVAEVDDTASQKDKVLEVVTRLAMAVRKKLGDPASATAQLFAMKSISATSLDVVSQYANGIELQSKGKYEDARQAFLKALQLDPKFGLGYQSLAAMSRNVGNLQDSEKYAKEGLQFLDSMTERERFNARGYYYRMTGDLQQCVAEYGQMIARYSADTVAHNQRAICLMKLRNMTGAVDEMRQAVRILPNHATYRANLAIFTAYAGDFAAAEQEVRAMENPPARALVALALSQSGQGLIRDAEATYKKVAGMGAFGATYAPSALGDLAAYEGRYSEAAQILEQSAEADLAAKRADNAANKFVTLAYVELRRGQPAAAVAAAEKALANSQAMPFRFLAARILVEAGASDKAQSIAADLSAQLAAEPQAYGKIIQGDIALKKKDVPGAVKLLNGANGVLDTWLGHFDLGRAYLAGGAFAQADSEFDICIKRRGETLSLLDEDPTSAYFPAVQEYQALARQGLRTPGATSSSPKS